MLTELPRGRVYCASAEDVYPLLAPGSVALVHSDGPYALEKDSWDKMKPADLPRWYEPHIVAWGGLCAPSASVYHWGTAEGWAAVHPVYLRHGWTFRALITWDKGIGFLAGKIDTATMRMWPNVTEVCGFYQREGVRADGRTGSVCGVCSGASEGNQLRTWLQSEKERSGVTMSDLKAEMTAAGGAGEMIVRHSFYDSQWRMPTWDQWRLLHQIVNARHGGPYLQRDCSALYEYEALRAEYEALRAEYEALRAPFTLPVGVTNVWRENQVQGKQRLRGDNGKPLHPCQKPDVFADRVVRASTRPGELVLEPFAGTARVAVACERMAESDARRYVCVEPDRRYADAAVAQVKRESNILS